MNPLKEESFSIKRLSRYELINQLGQGAMGRVFLAEDPVLKRQVAIKVIALDRSIHESDRQEFLNRFAFEAQACARLSHPSIVAVYDAGEQDGIPWIAFEYVKGKQLDQLLRESKVLAFDKIRTIIFQIGSALNLAHQQHIIHRDVKPANILIDSASGLAKLADFGVVKAPWIGLTRSGVSVGSPGYMSPEQIDGSDVDPRSDLFSFGVVLYELITGKHPFLRDTVPATFFATINQDYLPLKTYREDVPPDLENAVDSLLKASRNERISSAAELISLISQSDSSEKISLKSVQKEQLSLKRLLLSLKIFFTSNQSSIKHWDKLFSSRNKTIIKNHTKKITFLAIKYLHSLKNITRQKSLKQTVAISLRKAFQFKYALLISAVLITGVLILFSYKPQKKNIPLIVEPLIPSYVHQFDSLLSTGNPDSAYKLIRGQPKPEKSSWSELLLGRLELKKGNYITADIHFKAAPELIKSIFKYQIDLIIDDLQNIFQKEKAPESLIYLVSRTLSLGDNKRVHQWLSNNQYWLRWNTVKVMETAGKKIDMVDIYMLDLNSTASMRTRIRAAEKLGELGDRRAVPLLEDIGSKGIRDPFVSATARNVLSRYFKSDSAAQIK
ncbi:MAG TPA: protein kinase [Chitinispirillaceae bacterium]|nr:protein kinase [Chitinispirillaceae bacterium]